MINYSIIIPHYNIPDLLIRCVRSIPVRDDVEVIVVDDNSPEGENYPKNYPDLMRKGLTYIHLDKNIGGGGGRNVGLKHAKGKWLIFADADDFFNYCFNDILNDYEDSDCDVIYLNANSVDTETYVNTGRSAPVNKWINRYMQSGGADKDADYELRYCFGTPWCKIIKSNMVRQHHIIYEETPIHNDTQFGYLIGYYAKKIGVDIRASYCITDREGSVSRVLDADRYLTRVMVFAKKYSFLHSHDIEYKEWRFIESVVEYYQEHNLTDYLEKTREILSDYGIDMNFIMQSVISKQKHHKRRVLKMKIIDRVNIELKKLLRFNF